MPHSTQTAPIAETREQLLERIADLERSNAGFQAGRRAALNLMEDAILAKQRADELNVLLRQEVAERERTATALRESEEKYRTLFNSIDEGFCTIEMIFDKSGKAVDYRFLQVNASFLRQTGLENTEGRRMREFVPEHEDYWFEVYGEVARTREAVRFEHEAAGLERWYDVFAFPVDDPELNRVGVLFNDVTARKDSEAELKKAHDELESRVEERTRQLAHTNDALTVEVEERKALERARVELIRRVVTTQEEERRRISRDLHDQLGQQMTALRLKLTALRGATGNEGEMAAHVRRLQEIADNLDSEISFLSSELRPTSLDDLGLEEALRGYTSEWSEHFNLPLDFHCNFGAKARANGDVETHLYRIAQEALNNVVKHSKATHVAVLLEKTADGVSLVIEDNGFGFDVKNAVSPEPGHGLGLVGIRERANLIGGEIEIESEAGQGTTIYVKVRDQAG